MFQISNMLNTSSCKWIACYKAEICIVPRYEPLNIIFTSHHCGRLMTDCWQRYSCIPSRLTLCLSWPCETSDCGRGKAWSIDENNLSNWLPIPFLDWKVASLISNWRHMLFSKGVYQRSFRRIGRIFRGVGMQVGERETGAWVCLESCFGICRHMHSWHYG